MRQQLEVLDSCRKEIQTVQTRYDKLLESAPDAMLFVNRDARIMLINAQMEKLFGYSEEELTGKELHLLIPERYRNRHRTTVATYFSNPSPRPMGSGLQIYGLKKDGTEFPADISLSPLVTDGELLVIGSIRDITDRKRAELQIERNYQIQRAISSILSVSLEPVSLEDQLNKVLDLILAIPGLFPHATGSIFLAEDDPDVLVLKAPRTSAPYQPELCEAENNYCIPIVSSGQKLGLVNIITAEGSQKIPEAEAFLVAVANTLAAVIMRHQAETDRNRFRERLAENEKLAALGRIAANVADEVRNPLTAIGGFSRRLEKKLLKGSKENEYVAFIVAEVTRLESIVRSVLSLSKEAGSRLERCNLQQIAEEALLMFEEACRERSVTIERRYAETPLLIECQEEHILEAVENLISNAIDAMPGGGALTVAVGKETIKGSLYATIRVTDTGEGIQDEHLAKIFEPFFTTRVASKGVGLGLSLTKKFVEDHDGTVSVESGPASGSTFTLRLPALIE